MIEKPHNCHYLGRRETSMLYFKDGVQGEYDIRGGVCFPFSFEPAPGKMEFEGFAVLAGMEIATKKVFVFEQRAWMVVENIIGENGAVDFRGVADFLNSCWSRYFGQRFYHHQNHELKRKYILEIIRSQMVEPKPAFIEVPWGTNDDAEALHVVWKAVKLRAVAIDRDSILAEKLQLLKTSDIKYIPPAVHALMCVLMAYERFPWRAE